MKRFLVACEDAGAASALAPVVQRLLARGDSLRYLVGAVAARIFASEHIVVSDGLIDDEAALVAALATISPTTADALLCGTSAFGLRIDARATSTARKVGMPVLGIVDFPSNYRERFEVDGALPDGSALADTIAVIDQRMREDMVRVGFDESRLVVTGPPSFDEVLASAYSSRPTRRPTNEALFLSQPVARFCGSDEFSSEFLGYTEASTLSAVLPLIRRAGLVLRVRPHPRETPEERAAYERSFARGDAFSQAATLEDAVASARIVLGMNTMALTAAALLGAPALSVQLGLRGTDMLISNRVGLTVLVTSAESLEREFARALDAPPDGEVVRSRAAALGWQPGATGRVVDALDALARRSR